MALHFLNHFLIFRFTRWWRIRVFFFHLLFAISIILFVFIFLPNVWSLLILLNIYIHLHIVIWNIVILNLNLVTKVLFICFILTNSYFILFLLMLNLFMHIMLSIDLPSFWFEISRRRNYFSLSLYSCPSSWLKFWVLPIILSHLVGWKFCWSITLQMPLNN